MKFLLIILTLFLISCSSVTKREKIIIYLHGMGMSPIKAEKFNIIKISNFANRKGYGFVSPEAKSTCGYLKPKRVGLKCWDHTNINSEVKNIFKNIPTSSEVIIIGFSNGGYLLGGALQLGYLKNVSRVGIISGGPVGSISPKNKIIPKVFIEVGVKDKWNKKWGKTLYSMLSKKNKEVYFRKVDRDHFPTPDQILSFTKWVLYTD